MTTTQITYGKKLTVIQENLTTGLSKVFTRKIGQLESIINGLECFAIKLDNSKVNKTVKKIEALGFDCDIDDSFGFEWECKIYCSL